MSQVNQGTPKTLRAAIQNGLSSKSSESNLEAELELHVLDFLAQKFTPAMLKSDPKTGAALEVLWERIKEVA